MRVFFRWARALQWPQTVVGAGSLAFILWTSVFPAMQRLHTDFSNYYLPSRLVARGEATAGLYDFSWFQRRMVYAGIEDQSGGFDTFPPPAGLVMLPLGWMEPLAAKQVWTVVNLLSLLLLLGLLERLAGLPFSLGLALAALSGLALRNNFLYGQFYIVLALLIVGSLALGRSGRPLAAGTLLGLGTAIKLYPAPLLLYFALRREGRVLVGFSAALFIAFAFSIAAFGWDTVAFYFSSVLPRSLAGLTENPFHPAGQTWTGLLRRLLVREPTLNPSPLLDSPFAFYLLRDLFSFGIFGGLLLAVHKKVLPLHKNDDLTAFSLLVLALLLLSPTAFSYHGFLAFIPAAFWLPRLWREGHRTTAAAVAGLFVLALSPAVFWWLEGYLRPLGFLAILALLVRRLGPVTIPRLAVPSLLLLSLAHAAWASRGIPGDGAVPIAWDAPRVESPAAAPGRLVYSAIDRERYLLRGDLPASLSLPGNLFSPAFAREGVSLFFELSEKGGSRILELRNEVLKGWTPEFLNCTHPSPSANSDLLAASCSGDIYLFQGGRQEAIRRLTSTPWDEMDPSLAPDGSRVAFASKQSGRLRLLEMDLKTGLLRPLTLGRRNERAPRYSPGGDRLAFARQEGRSWDIWLLELGSGREGRLTRDPGNDLQPEWSPDGRSLYFASDRGRGIFMPAIYRLDLAGEI